MQQEQLQDNTTVDQLMSRLGARNYQQLALIDRRLLIEGQSSDALYQQKDYLYHQISTKVGLEIKKQTNQQAPQLNFTKFDYLVDYIDPNPWNMEIIGPSLSGKSMILQDLAMTMAKTKKVLLISVFDTSYYKFQNINQLLTVIIITKISELFLQMSMALEEKEQYALILVDGLSTLFYQANQLSVIENIIEEFQRITFKLKSNGIQLVITSISKSKDLFGHEDEQLTNPEKLYQKSILNQPWNIIWHSQLSLLRSTETRTDANGNNRMFMRLQYFYHPGAIIKQALFVK